MLSKNKIKFINTLKKKKTRNETALFLAEGEKIVKELLNSDMAIEMVCARAAFIKKIGEVERNRINEIIEVTDHELKKISNLKTPNEVLALVSIPSYEININNIKNSLTLGLDQINDPGNLGTIIRIADWFGIKDIVCSLDTVDIYNPKAVQATMGSISRIRVHYTDLNIFINELINTHNHKVYGCFLEGENIYKKTLDNKALVLMGSESHGISNELKNLILDKLYIPNFSPGNSFKSESLNVSIATGIVCSEFRRRM
jgi:TrmH family RNA methyltransferase